MQDPDVPHHLWCHTDTDGSRGGAYDDHYKYRRDPLNLIININQMQR